MGDDSARKVRTGITEAHRAVAETWESASAGWARHEAYLVAWFAPVTQRLIRGARLAPGMRVLDVGGGIGDPALAAADAVAPGGSVLSVDLSAGMLATARQRAQAYGLGNVVFQVGAGEEVAAPAGSFDAVLARFSIMFFPNPVEGLQRLHGLLAPGGRIALSVWAPPELNEGFVFPSQAARAAVPELPPSDPNAPGPFRLSGEGELGSALASAGYHGVHVEDQQLFLLAESPQRYWEILTSVSDSFRRLYLACDVAGQQRIHDRIVRDVERFRSGEILRLPVRARLAYASA